MEEDGPSEEEGAEEPTAKEAVTGTGNDGTETGWRTTAEVVAGDVGIVGGGDPTSTVAVAVAVASCIAEAAGTRPCGVELRDLY